ncbi:MAG TPA: mechanosensitive ion channel family protein [Polyangiaceae bacterium]
MDFDFSKLDWEQYAVAGGSALAILVIGWMIAAWAGNLVRRMTQRSGRISPTLIPLFSKLTHLTFLMVAILAALEKIGVQTGGFFAMIGAAGLAIGLALKDTVADVAAGVALLILRPFDVGDAVKIGDTDGSVTAIDMFQTKLTSFEGVPIVLNNSAVRTAVIQNFTRAQTRRVDLEVGVSYSDEIGKALAAIEALLDAEPRVLKDPAKLVKVNALGDSAVVLLARYHTQATDFLDTKLDLTRALKERLDREGISIPFPQRDLRIVSAA